MRDLIDGDILHALRVVKLNGANVLVSRVLHVCTHKMWIGFFVGLGVGAFLIHTVMYGPGLLEGGTVWTQGPRDGGKGNTTAKVRSL